MSKYPTNRKNKLSSDEDKLWYSKTFLRLDSKGKTRRYISGNCDICGEYNEATWDNFTRCGYKIRHLKCSQKIWNDEQVNRRNSRSTESVLQKAFISYTRAAKRRGHIFELSLETFSELVQRNCFYCGQGPRPYLRWGHVAINGIDRIDNTQGYTADNSQTCCTCCNFVKRDTTAEEWFAFLLRVRRS